MTDIDQIVWPRHDASFSITHNEHKSNYQTAEDYARDRAGDWVSEEERAKAIAEDSIWEIQWYPNTPVGCYIVAASTLSAALAGAMEVQNMVEAAEAGP